MCIAAGYVVLALAPAWWLAPVATVAIGLGFYMLHNTLQTNATQMTPQARGTAVALFSSAIFVGQTVGVATGALVIDRLGAVPLFLGAAAALPVLAIWFARRIETAPAGEIDPPAVTASDFDQRHLRHRAAARRLCRRRGRRSPAASCRGEERRLALARRGSGSFSGRGFTGPSGYSKLSLLLPASSVTTTTRTWPPYLSRPNSTSSASAFLMCSWITRAIGRAPISSS